MKKFLIFTILIALAFLSIYYLTKPKSRKRIYLEDLVKNKIEKTQIVTPKNIKKEIKDKENFPFIPSACKTQYLKAFNLNLDDFINNFLSFRNNDCKPYDDFLSTPNTLDKDFFDKLYACKKSTEDCGAYIYKYKIMLVDYLTGEKKDTDLYTKEVLVHKIINNMDIDLSNLKEKENEKKYLVKLIISLIKKEENLLEPYLVLLNLYFLSSYRKYIEEAYSFEDLYHKAYGIKPFSGPLLNVYVKYTYGLNSMYNSLEYLQESENFIEINSRAKEGYLHKANYFLYSNDLDAAYKIIEDALSKMDKNSSPYRLLEWIYKDMTKDPSGKSIKRFTNGIEMAFCIKGFCQTGWHSNGSNDISKFK
jgi:hypothetical protein